MPKNYNNSFMPTSVVDLLVKSLPSLFLLMLMACNQPPSLDISAVAHAGGGINSKRYTNSIEALNHNYDLGFELFEIDFSWTSDGQLVCLHDWDKTASRLFNYDENKPTSLMAFKTMAHANKRLTPCTLDSLDRWLATHPKAYVITDIKGRNINRLNLILDHIKNAKHKVIPQFTQPEHFQKIKNMGFENLIWTLFSYNKSNEELLQQVKDMQLFAITMPKKRTETGVANQLKAIGFETYVHTINDLNAAKNYQSIYGLSSVYTDFLPPDF